MACLMLCEELPKKREAFSETLLQIRPGSSLSKGVTPEEQGRAGGFDELVSVLFAPVTLVILSKGANGRPS
jgi:hypothetical protein